MRKYIFSLFAFSLFGISSLVQGQEMWVSVSVSAPQFQSDKAVFDDMQKNISEYLNNRKWTDHKFQQFEKIKANMVILINKRPEIERFEGSLQLRVTRPVYNSTYETVLLDIQDKDFVVNYVPFQTLEFSENSYIDNITSILNFYAYIILGFDYDTYSLNGGSEYFSKAQNIVSLAANSQESGWNSFDGQKSRYWLGNNLINTAYKKFHNVMYIYHRQGLDLMEKDLNKARQNILATLKEMQKLNLQNPGSYIARIFTDAKDMELVGIFKDAFAHEKQQFLTTMESLDPAGMNQYRQVMQEDK